MQPKNETNKLLIVMGVSGCGKSTIATALAAELDYQMIDADDHHTDSAVEKMRSGIALTDEDRKPWFTNIYNQVTIHHKQGIAVVLACSALKRSYRDMFRKRFPECNFIWLRLDKETVVERIQNRKGHFFDASLVQNQFDTLEEPHNEHNVIVIDADQEKETMIKNIVGLHIID